MARTKKIGSSTSVSENPPRQTQLELVIIGLEEAKEKLSQEIEEAFSKEGVQVVSKSDWGLRVFAKPIKKQRQGIYCFYIINIPTDKLSNFEKGLRLNEKVLRFSLVRAVKSKKVKIEKGR